MKYKLCALSTATILCAAIVGCQPSDKPAASSPEQISQPAIVATPPTTRPLEFSADSMSRAVAGKQTSTTRQGIRNYAVGFATTMKARRQSIPIVITDVKYAKFEDLTEAIAKSDGYASLDLLKSALKKDYPDIAASDMTTTVYFKVTNPSAYTPASRPSSK